MKTIMYHYVRPLGASRYPAIKGRGLAEFKGQIAHLRKHFHLCSPIDVFSHLKTGQSIPENWVLLTFDDGYADHFRYVLPVLHDAKISALFFPPVSVVLDRTLLDVNKIHFILAACPTVDRVFHQLITLLGENGLNTEDIDELKRKYFHANRFDGPETIFIKRVLQKGLPFALRNALASKLFSEFVSIDETAFAEELYLSLDECRTMAGLGMCFGSHGRNHYWMGEMDAQMQEAELLECMTFLRSIHASTSTPLPGLAMCYPYGSYNTDTIAVLKKLGFAFGLTTQLGESDFSDATRYQIKRYDTNDFPVC